MSTDESPLEELRAGLIADGMWRDRLDEELLQVYTRILATNPAPDVVQIPADMMLGIITMCMNLRKEIREMIMFEPMTDELKTRLETLLKDGQV